MPLPRSTRRMRPFFGEPTEAAAAAGAPPPSTISSGLFQGLTPGERSSAIWTGLMSGNRYLGGIVNRADQMRASKQKREIVDPFAQMLSDYENTPGITPERKIEIERDRSRTLLGTPTYEAGRAPPAAARRRLFTTDVPQTGGLMQRFYYSGAEPPEAVPGAEGSPWVPQGVPRAERAPRSQAANEQRRRLADSVRQQLQATPPAKRQEIIDYYLKAQQGMFGAALPKEGSAFMEYYPGEAAALTAGQDPYAPKGQAPADDAASWEAIRKQRPALPSFESSSPALRALYRKQFSQ